MIPSDAAPHAPCPTGHSLNTGKHDVHAPIRDLPALPNTDEALIAARELFATCADLERRVNAFLERQSPVCPGVDPCTLQRTQTQTRRSLEVIKEAVDRYSLNDLALSYNGGKDCLVLLILYLAALPSYFTSNAPSSSANHVSSINSHPPLHEFTTLPPKFPSSLPAVYIEAPHPFPDVDAFVENTSKAYHLSLIRHEGAQGMRTAFASYLAQTPQIHAIFVGTRRSDPHGANLEAFQATDRGWPAFMRVHPVLEWRYEDVWTFLREMRIPYCDLYDQGYTSLGGRLDTNPNPALRKVNGAGEVEYRPAYELVGEHAERLGRDK